MQRVERNERDMQRAKNALMERPKENVFLIGSAGIPIEMLPQLRSAKEEAKAASEGHYRAGAD
jgi:hypothetical protein